MKRLAALAATFLALGAASASADTLSVSLTDSDFDFGSILSRPACCLSSMIWSRSSAAFS